MAVPRIKIFGERNTGTNYLSKLIDLNLHVVELPGTLPPRIRRLKQIFPEEFVLDGYFRLTGRRNLGWKHAVAPDPDLLASLVQVHENLGFVTITKNPYSWLLSLHKRPYHHPSSRDLNFETFLRSPWNTVRRERAPALLESPVSLWNLKNASYVALNAGSHPILNLRFEDLLDAPEAAIDRLQAELQCRPKLPQFQNLHRSAKGHDKDADYYRDYYLNEKWRQKLSAQAIQTINEQLDPDLMRRFDYRFLD